MTSIICKNCGLNYEGNFCQQCGQAATVHKINASYFLHDIPHSIFHIDNGLFYTFGQLFRRPGKTLIEYLQGKRVKHYKPLAYVLVLSAVSALLVNWNIKILRYLQHEKTGIEVPVSEHFFVKYQGIFIFLMIPLVTFCTWIIFKKNRFSFWEHMLVNTYLAAQLNVLVILIHVFILIKYIITGSTHYSYIFFTTLFMTGFMTYYAITFSTLMKPGEPSWRLGLKLGVMCFLLAAIYATSMAFAGITSPV
jgi:hypothetical protein